MDFVSPEKLLVVILIAIIVFGPKRIPELGHSLGKGIREFKASLDGDGDEASKSELPAGEGHGVESPPAAGDARR